MMSVVQEHVTDRLEDADIESDPFPHFYVEDVFPDDFYDELLAHLPGPDGYKRWTEVGKVKEDQYSKRSQFYLTNSWVENLESAEMREFWGDVGSWLMGREFRRDVLSLFDPYRHLRFPDAESWPDTWSETLLLRHRANYYIGPHTDMPSRVMNLLFYLPEDEGAEAVGTSVYEPKDPEFTCEGTSHHEFEDFNRVKTFPYKPNTVVGFLKTNRSFHGVEPISEEESEKTQRDVIQWMVYDNPEGAPKDRQFFTEEDYPRE